MLKIEDLRAELGLVSTTVENHKKVAKKAKISVPYLLQIRTGKNAKKDTEENRKLLSQLLSIYRKIGRKKEKELQKVLNTA